MSPGEDQVISDIYMKPRECVYASIVPSSLPADDDDDATSTDIDYDDVLYSDMAGDEVHGHDPAENVYANV